MLALSVRRVGQERELEVEVTGAMRESTSRPGSADGAFRGLAMQATVADGRQPDASELERLRAALRRGIEACA